MTMVDAKEVDKFHIKWDVDYLRKNLMLIQKVPEFDSDFISLDFLPLGINVLTPRTGDAKIKWVVNFIGKYIKDGHNTIIYLKDLGLMQIRYSELAKALILQSVTFKKDNVAQAWMCEYIPDSIQITVKGDLETIYKAFNLDY